MRETKANNYYNFKSDFVTMREIQDFEQENVSVTQPTLDSTNISTNTTNQTTSPIYSIPVGTKTPEHMPLTLPTYFPEQNGKGHVPDDPDPYPSLSDSLWKKNKRDKKKKSRKLNKDDSSDLSSSDNPGLSYKSDYRHKGREKKAAGERMLSNYAHV